MQRQQLMGVMSNAAFMMALKAHPDKGGDAAHFAAWHLIWEKLTAGA